MSKLTDTIKSVRQVVGKDWIRPPLEKLDGFIDNLQKNEEAMHYLKSERGFTEETIKHFRLGYDPSKDAIAIPIFKNSELINIKYRHLNPTKAKYSGEAGAETWIYNEEGIDEGKRKGGVLIVEGEFDLMSCWQNGIKNVVSPASGKDSYGVWLELIDPIPRVYIAYDNDKGGRQTSVKLAERTGVEKTFEVKYPNEVKDANEFFTKHTKEDFLELIKNASAFYTHQFKSVEDIIFTLMEEEEDFYELKLLPKVQIEKDWLIVLSGISNVGKTTVALNIVKELAEKKIPSLVMPFERGNTSVGKRFIQILFDKTINELRSLTKDAWRKLMVSINESPVFFTVPKVEDLIPTIIKSKRLFDTKFVVIDHLDYIVRQGIENQNVAISRTLQELKSVAMEHKVVIIVITHTRKIDSAGTGAKRKPTLEDLKGSSSLYQDPECVVMLSSSESLTVDVDILKNKGEMVCKKFAMNPSTGVMNEDPNDF